eukprot:GEMP01003131.1.p1 GENE.GEMP01003131.1~~GEMP01003131.1.p1  ORF type:complete len:880 (-),score=156.07 GEMP01003131.1:1918-4557(-)
MKKYIASLMPEKNTALEVRDVASHVIASAPLPSKPAQEAGTSSLSPTLSPSSPIPLGECEVDIRRKSSLVKQSISTPREGRPPRGADRNTSFPGPSNADGLFVRLDRREICILCTGALVVGLLSVIFNVIVANVGCLAGISGCHNLSPAFRIMDPEYVSKAVEAYFGVGRSAYFVLTTPFVGLAIYIFTEKVIRDEETKRQLRGGGTRQSLVATARGTVIHCKSGLCRLFLSALYLGSGAGSLGVEGPTIQISTSALTSLGHWTRTNIVNSSKQRYRMVLYATVGAASGVCAAFHCPVGGVTFAMEELGHISPKALSRQELSLISLASVMAAFVTKFIPFRHGTGPGPWETRHHVEVEWNYVSEYDLLYLLEQIFSATAIGLFGALFGHVFSRLQCILNERLEVQNIVPDWAYLPISALIVSSIGFVCNENGIRGIWGIGEEGLHDMFGDVSERCGFWLLLLFLFAKFASTTASATLGGPGGLLGPSLILGAILGRCFACLMQTLCGNEMFDHKPLVIFGMASFFSSIFRLPITAVVIPQELCGATHLTPQLMLVNYISIMVSSKLAEDSLFERLLQQDGVNLKLMHFDIQRETAKPGTRRYLRTSNSDGNQPPPCIPLSSSLSLEADDQGSCSPSSMARDSPTSSPRSPNSSSGKEKRGRLRFSPSKQINPYAHELPSGMTECTRNRLHVRRHPSWDHGTTPISSFGLGLGGAPTLQDSQGAGENLGHNAAAADAAFSSSHVTMTSFVEPAVRRRKSDVTPSTIYETDEIISPSLSFALRSPVRIPVLLAEEESRTPRSPKSPTVARISASHSPEASVVPSASDTITSSTTGNARNPRVAPLYSGTSLMEDPSREEGQVKQNAEGDDAIGTAVKKTQC